MRQIWRNVANCTAFSLNVEQGDVPFSCGIEFEDSRNAEPVFKVIPYIRRQSVAAGKPNPMLRFARGRRCVEQVAAKLSDVLK